MPSLAGLVRPAKPVYLVDPVHTSPISRSMPLLDEQGVSRGGTGLKRREQAQLLLRNKMAMTRDMALSWRIDKFVKEVGSTLS